MSIKPPPPEKIYEAWSAIASGRLILLSPADDVSGCAYVSSSNRKKTYHLRWHGDIYESTDSATWWQGYPGYPVIALLMIRGLLPYDAGIADIFASVDWNAYNKAARRDYTLALERVLESLHLAGDMTDKVYMLARKTYDELLMLHITVRRYRKPRHANA